MRKLFLHIFVLTIINLLFCSIGFGAVLSWDRNREYDLAGYRVYCGYSPENYSYSIDIGKRTECELSRLNLTEGVNYYISITAYDAAGNESDFSVPVEYFADDGISPNEDNCPEIYNPEQEDNEPDGLGDMCDPDDDNDEILDVNDNCRYECNPDQDDRDGDGRGNSCDVCPMVHIFGEDSAPVAFLRIFRDNVLSRTPEGRELIELYYRWSPVMVRAMEDGEFREWVREAVGEAMWKIGVRGKKEGSGNRVQGRGEKDEGTG